MQPSMLAQKEKVSFVFHSIRMDVIFDQSQLCEELKELFKFFPSTDNKFTCTNITYCVSTLRNDSLQQEYIVFEVGNLIFKTNSIAMLCNYLGNRMIELIVKELHGFLFLHAGVVLKNNEAIILPGSSGIGKSTLVMGLLERGFKFLSDELAVIDRITGKVFLFPRNLNIKMGNKKLLYVDINRFLPDPLLEPYPIKWVIFPVFAPDQIPNLISISKSECIVKLTSNSISCRPHNDMENNMDTMLTIAERTTSFVLITNNLDETCSLIINLINDK
jgi:hypothetical protein